MASPLIQKLNKALGARITGSRALAGGDIADVSLLSLDNHTEVVAKRPRADQPDTTATEAMMLCHLKENSELPVPSVLFHDKGILVISYMPHKGVQDQEAASEDIAHHIAALHHIRPRNKAPYYGFQDETVIGPLPQINTPGKNWINFFTDNRLMAMGRSCVNVGRWDKTGLERLSMFAEKLPDLIPHTPDSSLLHGDLWAGNMLVDGNEARGFIDPAISYGHREMDLAFIDLMGGLHPRFFEVYSTLYAPEPGFHEDRKAIYQLWPLLVHLRLFGGGYRGQIEAILNRFGC